MKNGNTRTTNTCSSGEYLMWFCCQYCWLRTDFTHCFSVSIVDFEQVNVSWVHYLISPTNHLKLLKSIFSLICGWTGVFEVLAVLRAVFIESFAFMPAVSLSFKAGCFAIIALNALGYNGPVAVSFCMQNSWRDLSKLLAFLNEFESCNKWTREGIYNDIIFSPDK